MDPVGATRVLVPILNSMRAGLGEGATLTLSAEMQDSRPVLVLDVDRAVGSGSAADDWRAAAMRLWVARKLLDQVGGEMVEPVPPHTAWRVVFPSAQTS
jgi:hypothetical protein